MKGYCIFGFVLIACISSAPIECMEKNDRSFPYPLSTSSSIVITGAKRIISTITNTAAGRMALVGLCNAMPYANADNMYKTAETSCSLDDVSYNGNNFSIYQFFNPPTEYERFCNIAGIFCIFIVAHFFADMINDEEL